MGSGLIYLAIVIVWAAILIPMFLRGRDAALEDRSVERFDHAMSILSQQEEAELPQVPVQAQVPAQPSRRQEVTAHVAERPARQARTSRPRPSLARRRARTLITLLALTVVFALLSLTPFVPLWAPLPFVVLLGSFVVHLRNQAVRQQRGRQSRGTEASESADPSKAESPQPAQDSSPERAAAEEQGAAHQSSRPAARTEFVPGPSRAVVVETKGTAAAATTEPSAGQGDLLADDEAWRPNPLPLPTYVTAPKAVRPIRVIDLTTPGAWTSGRLLDDDLMFDDALVMEDVLAEQVASDELDALLEHESRASRSDDDASRRAVGD